MDFSDSTGLTGIVEDIDFLCQTNSTSYTLKDKARNVNRWAYKAVVARIKTNLRWKFDDTNLTNLPIVTATLVASQQDYTLPTDYLKLHRVEVLNNDGDWSVLKPISLETITEGFAEFEKTDGLPRLYSQIGESIFLHPAPAAADVTLASGLKVIYTREFDPFASTDTTQEPGFADAFHRICSLGASYDYMVSRGDIDRANVFRQEVEALLIEFAEFEADKNTQVKAEIKPAHRRRDYE